MMLVQTKWSDIKCNAPQDSVLNFISSFGQMASSKNDYSICTDTTAIIEKKQFQSLKHYVLKSITKLAKTKLT